MKYKSIKSIEASETSGRESFYLEKIHVKLRKH